MRKLEEKAAEFESKMHKREEEFRKADNDRMRRFFNARFDDIPGALNGSEHGGLSTGRGRSHHPVLRGDGDGNFRSPSSGSAGGKRITGQDRMFTEHEMYQEPEYIRR